VNRRDFLHLAGLGLLTTPYLVTYRGEAAWAGSSETEGLPADASRPPERVFGLSVASGDPTPTGVVLWTRVNPEVWSAGRELAFEVAEDPAFRRPALWGRVAGKHFGPERDYTVQVDLDGRLAPGRVYYYRFRYDRTRSRTGRCRTLPREDDRVYRLTLGVVTCQDYTNGYYGAFHHLAREEVDYVVHLGDFIYETTGRTRFQTTPYPDRRIVLPSGSNVCLGLDDYRAVYRAYRSDTFFQRALERHTWIVLWDDHETANDSYWDYARDTLGAPDHPYQTGSGYKNDPALLNRLKRDAQRAWAEYVPARVRVNPAASRPHDYLRIYRRFRFGTLAELFLTDQRTYRSPHPAGEKGVGERYLARSPRSHDPARTMLGADQRDWLLQGMKTSPALWKVWGNEVLQAPLQFRLGGLLPGAGAEPLSVNLDAWDGYAYERGRIAAELKQARVRNLVVLTGDLHSYLAAYLKLDWNDASNRGQDNLVGVEYMTPAVTSANLAESPPANLPVPSDPNAVSALVRGFNPHIAFFNSRDWGYSTVEFNRFHCLYTAYAVDKSRNENAAKTVLRQLRTPVGRVAIEEV
jgi:alkaline phosphatase D